METEPLRVSDSDALDDTNSKDYRETSEPVDTFKDDSSLIYEHNLKLFSLSECSSYETPL